MNTTQIILIVAGSISLFIIIYILSAGMSSLNIIESFPINQQQTEVSMVYYLPTATVQLKALSSIKITNTIADDGSTSFAAAELVSIAFETTVNIIPDTDFPLGLKYCPSPFTSDEIKLTTGTTGLLDNINTSSDDRLAHIIEQVGDAPQKIFKVEALQAPIALKNASSIIKTYENTFVIFAAQVKNNSAKFNWKILTEGDTTIDSSFDVTITRSSTTATAASIVKASGIMSRPLTTVTLELTPRTPTIQASATTAIQIPDDSCLLVMPLKRSPLVKRVNTPKFSNGMLLENSINKPSEIEAGVSIPINILKAIVSIPAQLFNFKIQHKYQGDINELELQKKILTLQKEIEEQKKPKI